MYYVCIMYNVMVYMPNVCPHFPIGQHTKGIFNIDRYSTIAILSLIPNLNLIFPFDCSKDVSQIDVGKNFALTNINLLS